MASCQVCTAEIRYDYDRPSKGKPYTIIDVSREAPHDAFCKPTSAKPNPILIATDHVIEGGKKINLGFWVDFREDKIAELITKECVRCGLDPVKVRTERRGNFIILH